ncbi:MAG: hypothetical protein V4634_07260 [Pseudomonadota bacterium]
MRYALVVLSMLFAFITSANAQVSISLNLQAYPELVPVPGYPVYYSPRLRSNYFFYDGMYWVYVDDDWYESYWYNGPWEPVRPEFVPLFVLRVPVRYYRAPPMYFRGWRPDAPPRWGQHWGNGWERQRRGWDQWNRASVPPRAPLPSYQRQYAGNRYPRAEQQQALRSENYRYQPRDNIVRQHFQPQAVPRPPVPPQQRPQEAAPQRRPGQPDARDLANPAQRPAAQAEQRGKAEPHDRGAPVPRQEQPQAIPRPPVAPQPAPQRSRAEPRDNGEQNDRRVQHREQVQAAPPPAQALPQPPRSARQEPAPEIQRAERGRPAAAPPPRPEPASRAEQRGQEARPAPDKQKEKGEQDNRKQEK